MVKPTLALIPAAYGTKFYSVLPSDGTGDFNFSRSSLATRINSQGLIETITNGDSRLSYPLVNGVQKGCPHYLLEPQRTNSLNHSEDFSNTYWLKSGGLTVASGFLAPDGSLSAYSYSSDLDNRSIFRYGRWNTTEQTASIFAKKGTTDSFEIKNGNTGESSIFDLTNGDITSSSASFSPTIESYSNGWFKCSVTHTATANQSLSFTSTYAGTNSIYVWGAQLEVGSFATSIIPTSGSPVTRLAEVANGAGSSDLINSTEGVLYAEIQGLNDTDVTNRYISLTDGTTTNALMIQYRNNGELRLYNGGTSTAQMIYRDASADLTENIKLAINYGKSTSDYKVYINGSSVTIAGAFVATSMSGLNEFKFEYVSGGLNFYGNVKSVQVFKEALTDEKLAALTKI